MKGGVMDGNVYSFAIDAGGRKAKWAETGATLGIVHLDEVRIHSNGKLRLRVGPTTTESVSISTGSLWW
jgi:hypothetical protein